MPRGESEFSETVPSHGETIVHASCVARDGRAVLIRGASGSGKSGLALQLMALGAGLVADDRTRLWREGDIFRRQRGNWPEQPLPDHAARSDAAPAAYLPAAVPAPLSNARGHPSSRKAGRDTHDNFVQGNGRRRTTG